MDMIGDWYAYYRKPEIKSDYFLDSKNIDNKYISYYPTNKIINTNEIIEFNGVWSDSCVGRDE